MPIRGNGKLYKKAKVAKVKLDNALKLVEECEVDDRVLCSAKAREAGSEWAGIAVAMQNTIFHGREKRIVGLAARNAADAAVLSDRREVKNICRSARSATRKIGSASRRRTKKMLQKQKTLTRLQQKAKRIWIREWMGTMPQADVEDEEQEQEQGAREDQAQLKRNEMKIKSERGASTIMAPRPHGDEEDKEDVQGKEDVKQEQEKAERGELAQLKKEDVKQEQRHTEGEELGQLRRQGVKSEASAKGGRGSSAVMTPVCVKCQKLCEGINWSELRKTTHTRAAGCNLAQGVEEEVEVKKEVK